jgi:HSP20 family protein
MDPFKKDKNRRRINPFDRFGFDDDFFNDFFDERIFDDFKRMAEEMIRMMSQASPGKPSKPIVHGYKLFFGPDGKPHLEDFGNKPIQSTEGESSISEEREPLTDVIECDEDVSVTVEIPGVEKDDIDLNVSENQIEITVDTPQRKYHKIVNLPADVKPKTTKATYKNGVLDVIIRRKERKKDDEKGYKVNIQ